MDDLINVFLFSGNHFCTVTLREQYFPFSMNKRVAVVCRGVTHLVTPARRSVLGLIGREFRCSSRKTIGSPRAVRKPLSTAWNTTMRGRTETRTHFSSLSVEIHQLRTESLVGRLRGQSFPARPGGSRRKRPTQPLLSGCGCPET